MTKDEALKMAIDDLELCNGAQTVEDIIIYTHEAIQACKEALEQPSSKNIRDSFNEMLEDKVAYYKGKQPAQEPVATIQQWEHKEGDKWIANELPWDEMPPVGTKLYTHPVPLQNEFAKDDEFKKALEQPPPKVEPFDVWAGTKPQESLRFANAVIDAYKDGYEACKAEQPAQEPVAWMPIESAPKDGTMILVKLPRMMNLVVRARYNTIHKFWMNDYEGEGGIINPYYYHEGDLWHPIPTDTHPAPSWQGLSDDEILIICAKMAAKLPNKKIDLIFARAIEAKLKEKNT